MKCNNCNTEFLKDFEVCPVCGAKLSTANTNPKPTEVTTPKKTKFPALILLTIVAVVVIALLINTIGKSDIEPLESLEPLESSAQTPEELYDRLDFSALLITLDNYSNKVNNAFICDSDGDGRVELFAATTPKEIYGKNTVFAFETADTPAMSSTTHNGAAGEAFLKKATDGSAVLVWGYHSNGTYNDTYERYTTNGWNIFATSSGDYTSSASGEYTPYEQSYEGQITDYTSWKNKIDALGIEDYNEGYRKLYSNYFLCDNTEEIINNYKSHLDKTSNETLDFKKGDFDNDGKDEYTFTINNFAYPWVQNLTTGGTDGQLMQLSLGKITDFGTVFIYADVDEKGVLFNTFYTTDVIAQDTANITVADNTLCIRSDKTETMFFCMPVENASYSYNGEHFNNMVEVCKNYEQKATDSLCTTVTCDVSDNDGSEFLLLSLKNNEPQKLTLYSLYCGRMIKIDEFNTDGIATLITRQNSQESILTYSQDEINETHNGVTQRSSNTYSYTLSRYDENYYPVILEEDTIFIDKTTSPNPSENLKLEKLSLFLSECTTVCDPYELNGYTYANVDINDNYLYISNCSTSKIGFVNITDGWLNFREGAGTNYPKVLTHKYDNTSFVKQADNSPVTVLKIENTTDTQYPIWFKIQIKYQNNTLVGYSAQKYIKVPNITRLNAGDTFTVTAESNETDLTWASSDTSVLSIDAKTGKVTALKKGMVIVTVTSPSALTSSCIIEVYDSGAPDIKPETSATVTPSKNSKYPVATEPLDVIANYQTIDNYGYCCQIEPLNYNYREDSEIMAHVPESYKQMDFTIYKITCPYCKNGSDVIQHVHHYVDTSMIKYTIPEECIFTMNGELYLIEGGGKGSISYDKSSATISYDDNGETYVHIDLLNSGDMPMERIRFTLRNIDGTLKIVDIVTEKTY